MQGELVAGLGKRPDPAPFVERPCRFHRPALGFDEVAEKIDDLGGLDKSIFLAND